jgi:uncharacterized phiE125 gp8 family phage protein
MPMKGVRYSGPTSEPLSTYEAKQHMRIDHTDEDGLIYGWCRAAREYVEMFTGRLCGVQTWKAYADSFYASDLILPGAPLVSVTSVVYRTNGANATVSAATYVADTIAEPGRIVLASGYSWPSPDTYPNAVCVTYQAGYSDTPDALKAAMKLIVSNWNENREATISGTIIAEVPMAVKELLWAWRTCGEDN